MRAFPIALALSFAISIANAGGGTPGPTPVRLTITPQLTYETAVHEAGHVLTALELPCVHPIAVAVRGDMGLTRLNFERNNPDCLKNMLVVGAAGLAAERLILRQSRTGWELDRANAASIAGELTAPGCQVNWNVYDDQCMDEGIAMRLDAAMDQAYSILSLHQEELLRIADDIYAAGQLELGDPETESANCD
ncbi:hypothetical protein HY633_02600 [Candidatus Uhrbacteria bacterium]|nr:hypothetical protein [Candidatus Uhrbacteria bacterium]